MCGQLGMLVQMQLIKENNLKALDELNGVPFNERGACYRCVIVFMRFKNDPFPFIAQDSWRGTIYEEERGLNGFGYDQFFIYQIENKLLLN